MTTAEVAKKLRVSPRTVAGWVQDGRLPAVRFGRRWLIRAAGIERLLAAQEARG